LENAKLSQADLNTQLGAIRSELEQIEKELSPEEKIGLHELLLHFEKASPLKEQPKPLTRALSPRFALRPEQPSLILDGQQIVPYTEPHHVMGAAVIPSFDKKEPLTFHKTVFVPPVEDKPDKGKEGQTTLI